MFIFHFHIYHVPDQELTIYRLARIHQPQCVALLPWISIVRVRTPQPWHFNLPFDHNSPFFHDHAWIFSFLKQQRWQPTVPSLGTILSSYPYEQSFSLPIIASSTHSLVPYKSTLSPSVQETVSATNPVTFSLLSPWNTWATFQFLPH